MIHITEGRMCRLFATIVAFVVLSTGMAVPHVLAPIDGDAPGSAAHLRDAAPLSPRRWPGQERAPEGTSDMISASTVRIRALVA
jgi:hypothetical protein